MRFVTSRWSAGSSLLLVAGVLASTVAACRAKDDGGTWVMTGGGPNANPETGGTAGQTEIGNPDTPASGDYEVDPDKISGTISGDIVTITIPAKAPHAAAKGTLTLSLLSVDNQEILHEKEVPFELSKESDEAIVAEIDIPEDVKLQSDLVRYNVQISDGKADGLLITRSLLHVVTPYEVRVEGPKQIKEGRPATYRVQTRHAVTRQPLEDFPVTLDVTEKDAEAPAKTLSGKTDEVGVATFELEEVEQGEYTVSAETSADETTAMVEDAVEVLAPTGKVLLTSDKPIYQPGQVIHLRALALEQGTNTPRAEVDAVFEIEDGKGNKIFKRTEETNEFGVAAARFQLGQILNTGTFKLRVTVEGKVTEKTVDVSRYALPKFGLGIDTDKDFYLPGETITGVIDAQYFFGQPVADADVVIEAYSIDVGETLFQRVQGRTADDGRFTYSVQLPDSLVGLPLEQGNALAYLGITVTDAAGQQVVRQHPVTVAPSPVQLSIVPEGGEVVPGLSNRFLVFASAPDGTPVADETVSVTLPDGTELELTTDAFGQAQFEWDGEGGTQVRAALDDGAEETFTFTAQTGGEHVLLRTDAAVYEVGQTVAVEITTSQADALVYVDWITAGQVVDMRTLEAEEGKVTFEMPLDTTLLGSNRLEAYVVDEDGNIVRTSRTVFVRGSSNLTVELTTDKPIYAPGEPAQLTFNVTDENGAPAVAALGVQIVDEAVFALVEATPGLLKTYFELEDAFAVPHYQIRPPVGDLTTLLLDQGPEEDPEQAAAAQDRAAAKLAALGGLGVTGIQKASWPEVVTKSKAELDTYITAEKEAIGKALEPKVEEVKASLAAAQCTPDVYYCTDRTYAQALLEGVAESLSGYDFWGNAYEKSTDTGSLVLKSNGPDELSGTGDDFSLAFLAYDLDEAAMDGMWAMEMEDDFAGVPAMNGGVGAGSGGASGVAPEPPSDPSEEGGEPRVRSDFPETLYVNPAVITDSDGTATVEVPMADSITEWRVSSLANTKGGKLGGGVAGVTVFQDFFVDIDFPATLTRGDQVTFPIAVYNYLDEPQSVELELEAADWYTPLAGTTVTVELEANEVRGVSFPVEVNEVGVGTLTVRAYGTEASDAVARTVRVEPDGKLIAETHSGNLPPGEISYPVTFPENAVEGSPVLFLNVYPAYLSQVVEGMDSMLQTPTGCFEQTTSSTWPNVLVTEYMTETGQITPEIQMKAESLISAGYQRLLTFEHPGGGFSWFGTQDPAPYLSVTAFGLMEFADMAAVHTVDEAMVERTRQWLINQQAADGSWEGDQSEFFTFHTSTVRNTAFVVWSLGASGYVGSATDAGLDYVASQLTGEDDAYTLGMVLNAYAVARPSDSVVSSVLAELDELKRVDGDFVSWDTGGSQTNFYGSGNDGDTATTAVVAHGLLLAGGGRDLTDGALAFLTSRKDELGNFGSTQATVWTLKTLLLAASKGTESAVGTFAVEVDGEPFSSVELTADQGDVMTNIDLSTLATAGTHEIHLEFVGTGKVSYSLVGTHHVPWTDVVEPQGPLAVTVEYDKTTLRVNEMVTATVRVTNNTEGLQNMVLVTLGMPPGFQVVAEDLDQYLQTGVLSAYEPLGKQLNLYVSELAASTDLVLTYRLQATMPVRAADGGAVAYPYYEPDKKTTAAATTIEVTE